MNNRVTLISEFNDNNLEKINFYIKKLNEKLCKVPFCKNINNREIADTLPYHFTLSAWNIEDEGNVLKRLSKIKFTKLKILVKNVGIMNGKENSYVLYFNIEENEKLK